MKKKQIKEHFIKNIVIIGAGNVGYHLIDKFLRKGIPILQVYSRSKTKTNRIEKKFSLDTVNRLREVTPSADLYIVAVKDDAIPVVAKKISKAIGKNKLVVHTSGSVPATVFKPFFKKYGVFYPLQTLSTERKVSFEKIPVCVDSNSEKDLKKLMRLAKKISKNVHHISDDQRAVLHVAAVFVSNFTNYMYTIGESILSVENLSFELLHPLILETAKKIKTGSPKQMQTGPAIRGDRKTIEKHLLYLEKYPDYQMLYDMITKEIQK